MSTLLTMSVVTGCSSVSLLDLSIQKCPEYQPGIKLVITLKICFIPFKKYQDFCFKQFVVSRIFSYFTHINIKDVRPIKVNESTAVILLLLKNL